MGMYEADRSGETENMRICGDTAAFIVAIWAVEDTFVGLTRRLMSVSEPGQCQLLRAYNDGTYSITTL